MEFHPLNLAHQQHRRAEAHLSRNKYDEAMQCHHNAAELLLDAMKSTSSSIALESITLQHSYHLKQKDLIKIKKEQYLRIKKAMDNLKLLGVTQPNIPLDDTSKIEVAIYRALYENDNLLKILGTEFGNKGDVTDAKKAEKSQKATIDELQILNQNIHSLTEQLVLQVEYLKDDNANLKEKVTYLEKERAKYLNASVQNDFNVTMGGADKSVEPNKDTVQRGPIAKFPNEGKPHNIQANFDLSALKIN